MSPPAFLSFLSADFERLLDLERSLGARLGPILRSGPSFVSSSPLIRYCLNRRFDHRFFDLFDNFIGYCLDRRFNCRFFCFSLCFSSCFNTLTKNFFLFALQSTLSAISSASAFASASALTGLSAFVGPFSTLSATSSTSSTTSAA